jgi:hypothetical protein
MEDHGNLDLPCPCLAPEQVRRSGSFHVEVRVHTALLLTSSSDLHLPTLTANQASDIERTLMTRRPRTLTRGSLLDASQTAVIGARARGNAHQPSETERGAQALFD